MVRASQGAAVIQGEAILKNNQVFGEPFYRLSVFDFTETKEDFMIINAKIHTMDSKNTVIEKGYIRYQNGKIIAMGDMDSIEIIDSEVLNLCGKSVYPGFVDAHTHLGMFGDSICFEGDDGNEDSDPIMPQLRAIDAVNPMDGYVQEALAAGITTVLTGPGSADPIAGQIAAVKTCGRCIDKMIIAAPVAIKFALGENPKSTFHDKDQSPVTRMATAALIRETLTKARRYYIDKKNAFEDKENDDSPEFDAKYDALVPLFQKEIPAHFHVHRADDIFTALRISKEFDIDCVLVHATEAHLITEELSEANIKGILSGPFLTDRSKPELKNMTPRSPGIISSHSIPTAIITDHPETPIQYLTLCAAVAVREGMDSTKALRAITIEPAKICGISERVGSIEIGKDADFVIYDGDPLDIMNKPVSVFVNGRSVFSRE